MVQHLVWTVHTAAKYFVFDLLGLQLKLTESYLKRQGGPGQKSSGKNTVKFLKCLEWCLRAYKNCCVSQEGRKLNLWAWAESLHHRDASQEEITGQSLGWLREEMLTAWWIFCNSASADLRDNPGPRLICTVTPCRLDKGPLGSMQGTDWSRGQVRL